MKKLLLFLLTFITFVNCAESDVKKYLNELKKMSESQTMVMVYAYNFGALSDLGFTLASIVWKESSFGKNTINDKDGKYGSFGLAQILLTTAATRNKVKTKKGLKELRLRLITDHKFNLEEAVRELKYWQKIHRETNKSKYWFTLSIASYNAGWKGFHSKAGKTYAKDVLNRIKALKLFFKDKRNFSNAKPLAKRYLTEIHDYLKANNVI